jgi:hypothetical protein
MDDLGRSCIRTKSITKQCSAGGLQVNEDCNENDSALTSQCIALNYRAYNQNSRTKGANLNGGMMSVNAGYVRMTMCERGVH